MDELKSNEKKSISRLYALDHTPINAHFSKNSNDFVVREIPLYDFSGSGEHLIVHLQKKDLTTPEALRILADFTGAKLRDFGYAGLKDREGLTSQFISLPAKFEPNLSAFSHEKIKILSTTCHNNKLRIGHLKGNSFFVRLKKVLPMDAQKIENVFATLAKTGFPNYFGYQRFGKFGDNAELGRQILTGEKRQKNPKLRDFLISAYQSEIFNAWLSKRVEISKFAATFSRAQLAQIYPNLKDEIPNLKSQNSLFRLLSGDALGHYPFGRCFLCEDLGAEVARFQERDITALGPIFGAKMFESAGAAKKIESEICPDALILAAAQGSRRFAWIYFTEFDCKYNDQTAQMTLSFSLPKGAYATVLLEEILHQNLRENAQI